MESTGRHPLPTAEQWREYLETWSRLTLLLTLAGHLPDLYKTLDKFLCDRPWAEDTVRYYTEFETKGLSSSGFPKPAASEVPPGPDQQYSDTGTAAHLSPSERASQADGRIEIEIDSVSVSDAEDSDDYIMDDFSGVSHNLITASADLSTHRADNILQRSDKEDNEQQFSDLHNYVAEDTPTLGDTGRPETASGVPNRRPSTPPVLDSEAPEPEQTLDTEGSTNRAAYTRLTVKRDLTASEISRVTELLLRNSAPAFVLSNSQSISAAWASSVQAVTSRGVVSSTVAAIDEVHRLQGVNRTSPLPLRYSYLQLKNAIKDVENAASKNILKGIPRKRGYGDASLALDTYFHVKENSPGEILPRAKLYKYKRIGSRWSDLAGRRPIQLCIYSEAAETVVCVCPPYVAVDADPYKPELFNLIT